MPTDDTGDLPLDRTLDRLDAHMAALVGLRRWAVAHPDMEVHGPTGGSWSVHGCTQNDATEALCPDAEPGTVVLDEQDTSRIVRRDFGGGVGLNVFLPERGRSGVTVLNPAVP